MRILPHALVSLCLSSLCSAAVPLQGPVPLPARFDMGQQGTNAAQGYSLVTPSQLFDPQSGASYGWLAPTSGTIQAEERSLPSSQTQQLIKVARDEDWDLVRDCIWKTEGGDLEFKAVFDEQGPYLCVLYLGDIGEVDTENCQEVRTPITGMQVRVEGGTDPEVVVASDVHARLRRNQNGYAADKMFGGFKRVTFIVPKFDIVDGAYPVTFRFSGGLQTQGYKAGCTPPDPLYTGAKTPVMSLEVLPYEPAPVYFEHTDDDPIVPPDYGELVVHQAYENTFPASLGAGIEDFNDHEYELALEAFEAYEPSTDEERLFKAWCLSWYAGWLTGEFYASSPKAYVDLRCAGYTRVVNPQILNDIEDLLTDEFGVIDIDSSAAVDLLQQVRDFRAGFLSYQYRGYSQEAYPPSNAGCDPPDPEADPCDPDYDPCWDVPSYYIDEQDNLAKHLACAQQFFEQADDDMLRDHEPLRPENPFYPRSRYWMARSMYGDNGFVYCDTSTRQAYNDHWIAILEGDPLDGSDGLVRHWVTDGSGGGLFPRDAEGSALDWFLNTFYAGYDNGGYPDPVVFGPHGYAFMGFDVYSAPTSVDLQDAWWLGTPSWTVSDPQWAVKQRSFEVLQRNAVHWWMLNRGYRFVDTNGVEHYELGGGAGDDVELVGKFGAHLIGKQNGFEDGSLEQDMRDLLRSVLDGVEIDPEEGYWGGLSGTQAGNTEHSAEYTSLPLAYLLPTHPGDPGYLEFAMRTIRNMQDLHEQDPSVGAWTGLATSPGPSDVYFRDPRLFKTHIIGATTIAPTAQANMDITYNVRALLPGFAVLEHNRSPRINELWGEYAYTWAHAALEDLSGNKPPGLFPGGILFDSGAFYSSTAWWSTPVPGGSLYMGDFASQAGDLYALLLRVHRVTEELHALDAEVFPGPEEDWTDAIAAAVTWLHDVGVVGEVAGDPLAPEGTEPWLIARIASQITKIAYLARDLDQIQSTQVEGLLGEYGSSYLHDLFLGNLTDDQLVNDHVADLDTSIGILKYFPPVSTDIVTRTDNVYLGDASRLLEMHTGSPSLGIPFCPITWYSADGEGELDVAILVQKHDIEQVTTVVLRAELVNFGTTERTVGLRLWRDLPVGDYQITIAPKHSSAISTTSFTYTGRSASLDELTQGALQGVDIPAGAHYVVRLKCITPNPTPDPPAFDLAIGPDDIELLSPNQVQVTVHNLGTVLVPNGDAQVELSWEEDPGPGSGSSSPISVGELAASNVDNLTPVFSSPIVFTPSPMPSGSVTFTARILFQEAEISLENNEAVRRFDL